MNWRHCKRRRGATIVEGAIIIVVFLTFVLGVTDLGLGVFRHNVLAEAARQGARQVIVHGKLAAPEMNAWGPATYSGTGADTHEIAQAINPSLVGIDPAAATITVEWLDGDNDVEDRARVTVTAPYRPIVTFIFGSPTFTLTASSTMSIEH